MEASTDKAVYNVNDTITVTVKTDASVTRVGLNNEAGNAMAVDGSYDGIDNGDGTKTFTITFALGTVGDRTMTVTTAGEDYVLGSTGATISFSVCLLYTSVHFGHYYAADDLCQQLRVCVRGRHRRAAGGKRPINGG